MAKQFEKITELRTKTLLQKANIRTRANDVSAKAAPPRDYVADLSAPHSDDDADGANHVNPDAPKKQSTT